MANIVRPTSGLAYPERFFAAASYVGLDRSLSSLKQLSSNFSNDTALLLYALHQQEEDPGWFSRASNSVPEPSENVQMNSQSTKAKPSLENIGSFGETKIISTANGRLTKTEDKDVVLEDPDTVSVYNQWTTPQTSGQPRKARYEHGAVVIQDKMYIYGGNHNVLDFKSWTWSRIETKVVTESQETSSPAKLTHCSGHSLITWENKLLSIGGHTNHLSESMQVKAFDLHSCTWSILKTYKKTPISRGGQSATLVGRSLMEWSRHTPLGEAPTPRAGHAGVRIGENWYIVGGGDNKNGASETVVLNMSTLAWSVVTSVQGRVPLASEGLSLVVSSYKGEDLIVAFGGYNGHYNNEVNALKPSHKSSLKSKVMRAYPVPDSCSALNNATTRDIESEIEVSQETKVREIVMDNVNTEPKVEGKSERIITTLKSEKEELEASLNKEKIQTLQLMEELTEIDTKNTELYKELQSVRSQLTVEQSRCFKLEVEVAELKQKLQIMETIQKELQLLQRQKAIASEQAAINSKQQSSGGVWGWLAGTPPPPKT